MEIRYTSAAQWADARDGVIPAPYALEAGRASPTVTWSRWSSTTKTAQTSA